MNDYRQRQPQNPKNSAAGGILGSQEDTVPHDTSPVEQKSLA
jgi:hypothetical protein